MNERKTLRIIAYCVEILICFVIEGIPGLLPEIKGALPTLTLAVCITVSLFESRNTSLMIGAVCGVLIDISSGTLVGPIGIVLTVLCFLISYLSSEFFQKSILFAVFVCIAGSFIGISSIFFVYNISGGINNYFSFCIQRAAYTFVLSVIMYIINKTISKSLDENII